MTAVEIQVALAALALIPLGFLAVRWIESDERRKRDRGRD
jgi:hypothetical protein